MSRWSAELAAPIDRASFGHRVARATAPIGALVGGVAIGRAALSVEPLVLSLSSLGCAAWVLAVRAPVFGLTVLLLFCVLLPYAVLPVRVVFSPTFVDVSLIVLFGSWMGRRLAARETLHSGLPELLALSFTALMAACLLFGLAAAPVSAEQVRLLFKLLATVLLFVAVVDILRDRRDLTVVLTTFLVACAGAAALALGVLALPRDQQGVMLSSLAAIGYPGGADVIRPVAGTETLRAIGTSVDPNVLGAVLTAGCVLSVGQLMERRVALRWPLLLGMLCVMLPALALTYSRSAWLGLAAGVGYLALVRHRRLWLALPALALLLLLAPQGQALLARLTSAVALQDEATQMRLVEYRDAATLIGAHPWFGVGFGAPPTAGLHLGVSSLYLTVAEHMGLVGLAVFIMVIVAVMWESIRGARVDPEGVEAHDSAAKVGLILCLQSVVVALLVAGLFDHYFFDLRLPHMSALFWMLLGFLAAASRPISSTREEPN